MSYANSGVHSLLGHKEPRSSVVIEPLQLWGVEEPFYGRMVKRHDIHVRARGARSCLLRQVALVLRVYFSPFNGDHTAWTDSQQVFALGILTPGAAASSRVVSRRVATEIQKKMYLRVGTWSGGTPSSARRYTSSILGGMLSRAVSISLRSSHLRRVSSCNDTMRNLLFCNQPKKHDMALIEH